MLKCYLFVQLAQLLLLRVDTLIVQSLLMLPPDVLDMMKDYHIVLIMACVAVMIA